MGVYHFMGVGRSVGVVTCAVDYIEKALEKNTGKHIQKEIDSLFRHTGGISHHEKNKGKIEAIVLFTSREVVDGSLSALPYIDCDKPKSVRQEILENLKKVWKTSASEGRKVYWCEVDIDNFQNCFERVIKVAYRFSQPGKTGKEIWCNLTGGSNSITFSLFSMSQLTAKSTTLYLISQRKDYQREVKVPIGIKILPNQDEYFNTVPFLKTNFDTLSFYEVLMELENEPEGMTNQILFDRIRNKNQRFTNLTLKEFDRSYLLIVIWIGLYESTKRS